MAMAREDKADQSLDKIDAVRRLFPSTMLDESTINRFLIARGFDVQKTGEMIQNYLDFRNLYNIDAIKPPNGIDIPYLMSVRKLFKDANYNVDAVGVKDEFKAFYPATGGLGIHGCDLEGHPIYIELLGKYNVKKMAELCQGETLKQFCILNNEFIFGTLLNQCSKIHGKKIEKMTAIFDCTGMGLHQFHIPGIMLLKVIASLNQDFYPERLFKIFIVNAPVFFSAAWRILKIGLDKRVLDKVNVLGSDYKSILLKHIRHDQLPSFLGGTCTCAHMEGGCVPSPGESIPPDHQAYRYKASLKKSQPTHEHIVNLQNSSPVHFKYLSQAHVSFEIFQDSKVLFSSNTTKLDEEFMVLKPGTYIFRWTGQKLTYRLSTLDYTIITKLEYSDSGIELVDREWVDAEESIDYEIFQDCDCTCVRPFETVILDCTVSEEYDGIVVTSKRSLEAIKSQIWLRDKKLFVVGPATRTKAIELGFSNILGSESGSASALVEYILRENCQHLLILTGDKTRNDLPLALQNAGVNFNLLKVYETHTNPNLFEELSNLNKPEWMVFFSPSGFDVVKSILKEFPKIACIGNTTAAHIKNLGYPVDAIAEKPDHTSLFKAIFKT